jgi:hypothetical protein
MHNVLKVEDSAFSVFEPFLGGLVAADVEVPGNFGDGVEVLFGVDVDPAKGTNFSKVRNFGKVIVFSIIREIASLRDPR